MATITGLTAARMLEIEGASVVDGEIVDGDLILTTFNGTVINAGPVAGPEGPPGPSGPAGGMIPGEIRLWSGDVLPDIGDYGKWVWANGAVYLASTYPVAAANIHTAWKTAHGQSDPGAGNFRVPDFRGLVPVGLDQMPEGARANRMTRSIAITLAGKSGEEVHVIALSEAPAHSHSVSGSTDGVGDHQHTYWEPGTDVSNSFVPGGTVFTAAGPRFSSVTGLNGSHSHGVSGSSDSKGGGGSHENTQPSVFIPYIVKLDD